MKLLVLSRYDASGASSRYRALQYFDYFKAQGAAITFNSLLDGQYLRELYIKKRRSYVYLLKRYWQRMKFLFLNKNKFDVAFITDGELFPYVPFFIERWFLPKRFIVDYDDAIFHYYDQSRSWMCRFLLGHKVKKIMRLAQHVIVGNAYIYEIAKTFGAKQVTAVPTVVDMEKYRPSVRVDSEGKTKVVIGWVGSPTTVKLLALIAPALRQVAQKADVSLSIIGGDYQIEGVPTVCENWPEGWNEAQEIKLIQEIDLGIMPLGDSAWERGKCGFKLIKYMACAKPLVASPVSINMEIVEPGVNGYLAASLAEWEEYLLLLIRDQKKRELFGQVGREKALKKYSLQVTAPLIYQLLMNAAYKS